MRWQKEVALKSAFPQIVREAFQCPAKYLHMGTSKESMVPGQATRRMRPFLIHSRSQETLSAHYRGLRPTEVVYVN